MLCLDRKLVKVKLNLEITGITEKMFKHKPREEIIKKAKEDVPLRTVTIKKSKEKRATPPAERPGQRSRKRR